MAEPEPEEPVEDGPSHFTPDIICPFCHHNVKKHKEGCIGKRFPKSAKDREENRQKIEGTIQKSIILQVRW